MVHGAWSTGHEAQGIGHVSQGMVYVQGVINHVSHGMLHVAWEHDAQDILTPLHCLTDVLPHLNSPSMPLKSKIRNTITHYYYL